MLKILLVDDHPDYLTLVRGLLRRNFTADIVSASSSLEAKEIIRNEAHFDFVVCDYQMPGGDGLEVFKFLKSEGKAWPFLLFTNNLDPGLIEFDGPNFMGVLSKTDFNQLSDRIRFALKLA